MLPTSNYPTDLTDRETLAKELTQLGYVPTQVKHNFDRDKLNAMIAAMLEGGFDWAASSLQPVILGPGSEVLGGHHRVIAAHIAGIDLATVPGPRPQVQRLAFNFRPTYDWLDVLPDVD